MIEAGVTAAGIRNLAAATDDDITAALADLDASLAARIQGLDKTHRRLRRAAGSRRPPPLPAEITEGLRRLPGLGFSARWVAAETALWIQVLAARDNALELFRARLASLDDPALRQRHLDYDQVLDLEPDTALTRPGGPLATATATAAGLKATPDGLANRLRLLRDTRRRVRRLNPAQIRMLPPDRS